MDAPYPRHFLSYLMDRFPDPHERAYVLAELARATLRAGNGAKVFLILHSTAFDTGKTTLVQGVGDMAGDYARTFKLTLLKQSSNAGPRDDWVERIRCRMIYTAEPDAWARVDSSMVKKATGTDDQSDRGLYVSEGGRDLGAPLWTPIMTANRLPNFSGFDAATRRRIRLIPFGKAIPVEAQNTADMREVYRAEADGILRVLVEALPTSDAVCRQVPLRFQMALDDAVAEMAPVHRFLADMTEELPGHFELSLTIEHAYQGWCAQQFIGEHSRDRLNSITLGRELTALGWVALEAPRRVNGKVGRGRVGRALTPEAVKLAERYVWAQS